MRTENRRRYSNLRSNSDLPIALSPVSRVTAVGCCDNNADNSRSCSVDDVQVNDLRYNIPAQLRVGKKKNNHFFLKNKEKSRLQPTQTIKLYQLCQLLPRRNSNSNEKSLCHKVRANWCNDENSEENESGSKQQREHTRVRPNHLCEIGNAKSSFVRHIKHSAIATFAMQADSAKKKRTSK